ncbi:MAG: class III signal peptide-containing protein [Candidatus Diapherotrites archaeon]
MESKAQGALEYLLLIGGAVLIAAIVIVILTGAVNPGAANNASGVYHTRWNALYNTL